jgi:mono/diheme cytochrome c family protein
MAFNGYATQGWFSPDLTQSHSEGLADWTVDDIVKYLKSGHNRYAAASGPMSEEVSFSSSQMTGDDLLAMAQYIKALPGQSQPEQPVARTDPYMVAGAAIYQDLCTGCHAGDGHGVANLIPDLARSGSVSSRDPTTLLRVVLEGTPTVSTRDEPTAPAMPGFGRRLSDDQVAAVTTYIRNSWGHAGSPVRESDVSHERAQLPAK